MNFEEASGKVQSAKCFRCLSISVLSSRILNIHLKTCLNINRSYDVIVWNDLFILREYF